MGEGLSSTQVTTGTVSSHPVYRRSMSCSFKPENGSLQVEKAEQDKQSAVIRAEGEVSFQGELLSAVHAT